MDLKGVVNLSHEIIKNMSKRAKIVDYMLLI